MHKKTPVWNARCLCAICSCSLASQSRPSSILLGVSARRRRNLCLGSAEAARESWSPWASRRLTSDRATRRQSASVFWATSAALDAPRCSAALAPRWLLHASMYMPLDNPVCPFFTAVVLSARGLRCINTSRLDFDTLLSAAPVIGRSSSATAVAHSHIS